MNGKRTPAKVPSVIDQAIAAFKGEWQPLASYAEKHLARSAAAASTTRTVKPVPRPASQVVPAALGRGGTLVSELRIRLAGFGGLLPGDAFDAATENAVKQFEQDVMCRSPTGRVDAEFAKRLDRFAAEYPIFFGGNLACACKICGGYGMKRHQGEYSEKYAKSRSEAGNQYEYPGIHRSLLWAARALMFYASKDHPDSLRFIKFSSGYRCHDNNRQSGRKTTNHMGKAVDMQFGRKVSGRWSLGTPAQKHSDADAGREVAKSRLRAQVGWNGEDRFSLEPGGDGAGHAPTWVHIDVRTWSKIHLADGFFAATAQDLDGTPLVELFSDPGSAPATDD